MGHHGIRRERRWRIKTNALRRDLLKRPTVRRLLGLRVMRIVDRDGQYMDEARRLAMESASRGMFSRYTRVLLTTVRGAVDVSTVWLAFDHGWRDDLPPLIFETMCFFAGTRNAIAGLPTVHYSSEAQARRGHWAVCVEVEARMRSPNCASCGKPCPYTVLCERCSMQQAMSEIFEPNVEEVLA